MNNKLSIITTAAAVLLTPTIYADPQASPYAGASKWKETKTERMEWFKDAKFGMFIHWGLYAPAGGYWPPENGKKYSQKYSEWIRYWANVPEPEYGKLAKPLFKPEKGCTDQWAKLAKDAGMKYTVLTTKHHDGYTLFNAKAPYSVKNNITGSTNISPKGRDMVAEYANSVRKQGLKVGYYYSLIDWQHPDAYFYSRKWPISANANHSTYIDYFHSHMEQLYTDYGKSDIVWVDYSDARHQGTTWKTKELLTKLHKLQPQAITNNRFWSGLQNPNGDFFTPEKYIPATGFAGRTFEVCHTMNESFGYSSHDKKWKSSQEVVHMLVDIVSKGGNLLLNVGPDARGRIPDESVKALRETGKWLKIHGDSIYGTQASPFVKLPFEGRCTSKKLKNGKTNLYYHIMEWPKDGKILLPVLKNKISSVKLVGSSKQIKLTRSSHVWAVKLPSTAPNQLCSVVELQIEGEPQFDPLMELVQQSADRSVKLNAVFAKVSGPGIKVTPESFKTKFAHVSHWTSTKAATSFSFNVHSPGPIQAGGTVTRKPGKYTVFLNYASANNGGGKLKLTTLANQKLVANIKPTGAWNRYQRKNVGEITLSKTGKTTIKIEASKINPAGFINIKSLELIPSN